MLFDRFVPHLTGTRYFVQGALYCLVLLAFVLEAVSFHTERDLEFLLEIDDSLDQIFVMGLGAYKRSHP